MDVENNDLFYLLAHYEEELSNINQSIKHLYDMIISLQKESDEKIRQASLHPQNLELGVRVQTSGGSDLSSVLGSISRINCEEIHDINEQVTVWKARKDQLNRLKISYDLITNCREKEIFEILLKAEKQGRNPRVLILQKGIQMNRAYKIRKTMLNAINSIFVSEFTTLQLLQISPMSLKKAQKVFLKHTDTTN